MPIGDMPGKKSTNKNKHKILSFDCANKSFAACLLTINTGIIEDLVAAKKKNDHGLFEELINSYIQIKHLEVYDFADGENVEDIPIEDLTVSLKKCISQFDDVEKDVVLIEYQMPINYKSSRVSHQILYHFIDKVPTFIVGPSLKNKVRFFKEPELQHSYFIKKYKKLYTANKNHTKKNFEKWMSLFGKSDMLKHIKKENLDDIADAFMQAIGWLYYGPGHGYMLNRVVG